MRCNVIKASKSGWTELVINRIKIGWIFERFYFRIYAIAYALNLCGRSYVTDCPMHHGIRCYSTVDYICIGGLVY